MSQFISDLVVTLVDPHAGDGTGLWQQVEEFQYYSTLLKKTVVVPKGFVHDFASVPRVPLLYDNMGNRYHRPATIHDYLCREGYVDRKKCDRVFLEAMRLQNDEEIAEMRLAGEDDDEIVERRAAIEGRAQAMYAAVVLYTKTGLWQSDVHRPGFEPMG